LANFYLNLLIAKTSPKRQDLVAITEATWQKLVEMAQDWSLELILQGQKKLKDSELQVKNTTQPRLWLEISLLTLLPSANQTKIIETVNNVVNQTEPTQSINHPPVDTKTYSNLSSAPSESSSSPQEKTASTQQSASPVPSNFSNWEQLKELVVQNCQQPLTKAFFTQNCHIIGFDGQTAQVRLRNKSLWEMANTSKKEIESAFSRIVQRPVTVFLQVNSASNLANSQPTSLTPEIHSTNDHNQVNQTSNSIANSSLSQSDHKSISSSPPIKKQKTVKSFTPIPDKKENSRVTSEANTTESQAQFSSAKTSKNAAENLAKSFKGEIVLIESKPPTVMTVKKITNRPQIEELSDDGEIPF
jgi:DNA polymerase-3 subunit gamma/tau